MSGVEAGAARAGRSTARGAAPGGRTVLLALAALLGAVAYRGLLSARAAPTIEGELQDFFFVPADTFPPVVLALSAWLLFRRRDRWLALPRASGPPLLGSALLLAACALLAWGAYTGAGDLAILSLGLCLLGFGALYKGAAGLRCVRLPALFLLFAVPLPAPLLNEVVYRLQIGTAEYAGWLLYLLGSPAFVSGEQILRSGESFAIIETCSGLRSIATLTMLAILMADLFRRQGWHALVLVAVAPLVAFVLNGLRAIALIFNPHSTVAALHNLQGIAMLLIGLLALFALDGALARLGRTRRAGATSPGPPRAAPAPGAPTGRDALAIGALAALVAVSLWTPPWTPPTRYPLFLDTRIPAEMGEWQSLPERTDDQFLGSTYIHEKVHRRYWRGAESVDLYVGVGDRAQRRVSLLSPKTALPGGGWIVEESARTRLEPSGVEAEVRVVRSGTRRLLVYHWHLLSDGLVGESLRSLFALDSSPMRHPGGPILVRLATELAGPRPADRELAEARVRLFLQQLSGRLDALARHLARKRFS